jgi:hypothetical protein
MAETGEKYTEARRALTSSVGPLTPGEVRTVAVAWRLDDPAVRSDGRFWTKVMEEFAEVVGQAAGAIVPKGKSLGYWRERADGVEVEVPNPITHQAQRVSIVRWENEDPERTYMFVFFENLPEEFAGRSPQEIDRIRDEHLAKSGATRIVKPRRSHAVEALEAQQADLQRQRREAVDRGDEQRMAELSSALDSNFDELRRADFPNHTRGWDLSRAIRKDSTFILDWTTGY